MIKRIHLNADLGEGTGNDELMMPHLSYCNIACGGHYGNEISIRDTIKKAMQYQVKIGAHPSYPDKENFGRKVLNISLGQLEQSLKNQLILIQNVAIQLGATIHHVKAHGALYHQIIRNEAIRNSYLKTLKSVLGSDIYLMLPAHIADLKIPLKNQPIIYEAFGDRKYTDLKELQSRNINGAVLEDIDQIEKQIVMLAEDSSILSHTGQKHNLVFDTICLHGDHPQLKTYFPKLVDRLMAKNILA